MISIPNLLIHVIKAHNLSGVIPSVFHFPLIEANSFFPVHKNVNNQISRSHISNKRECDLGCVRIKNKAQNDDEDDVVRM
jgi:hypothetical protein